MSLNFSSPPFDAMNKIPTDPFQYIKYLHRNQMGPMSLKSLSKKSLIIMRHKSLDGIDFPKIIAKEDEYEAESHNHSDSCCIIFLGTYTWTCESNDWLLEYGVSFKNGILNNKICQYYNSDLF